MTKKANRRLLLIGFVLVLLSLVAGVQYWLHARYHAVQAEQDHELVCSGSIPLSLTAGALAGCDAVVCSELLPSGKISSWTFIYC